MPNAVIFHADSDCGLMGSDFVQSVQVEFMDRSKSSGNEHDRMKRKPQASVATSPIHDMW